MSETKRLSKRERQEIRITHAIKRKRAKQAKTFIGFVVVVALLAGLFVQFGLH